MYAAPLSLSHRVKSLKTYFNLDGHILYAVHDGLNQSNAISVHINGKHALIHQKHLCYPVFFEMPHIFQMKPSDS